ncbi:Replication factor C subunit 5 [Phytophthora cinnamomi]|uniref:Replication factor C subunit 5 n=1 Tax=Phytophthora cinnamomi TaxID=4785 RepID=UPI00355AC476|nr:Replication factor C subunit 5 [Phytophthora cinnamomi]
MATPKPTKNPISSTKEFKTICVVALKKYPFRISNKAIRHLRLTMNTTISSTGHLPEALEVIFASLAERCRRRIDLEDIH